MRMRQEIEATKEPPRPSRHQRESAPRERVIDMNSDSEIADYTRAFEELARFGRVLSEGEREE